jgi:hypothetical protein
MPQHHNKLQQTFVLIEFQSEDFSPTDRCDEMFQTEILRKDSFAKPTAMKFVFERKSLIEKFQLF